jgi:serine/tyrosine/threonine adenylyltransferase
MSLGGVTIDYGPFAFMDYFSKDYVSNATDEHERYSYRRQPAIVEWNLKRLS